MTGYSRRRFLRRAVLGGGALFAPSLTGLTAFSKDVHAARVPIGARGYGELRRSEDCPELMIPPGFRCFRLSETFSPSRAGPSLIVPPGVDGMAAFALPNGNIRLIRNHEIADEAARARPIGVKPYDAKGAGGTTSLEIAVEGWGDELRFEVVREFVSLSGTHVNCAGGPTPWGSWLSCEETVEAEVIVRHWNGTYGGRERKHGYVFEVPVAAEVEVEPEPLVAMGRFVHEAIAVDPDTGIVYETEDAWYNAARLAEQPGAGFYRFIPRVPGELREGGRLQMLAIEGRPGYVAVTGQAPGVPLPVTWVDIDDPDPPNVEVERAAVLLQGVARGAAVFNRLEGCWYGDGGVYFNSTNGGDNRAGQVWKYRPDGDGGGELVLVFESPGPDVLSGPDNICVSPRGGVVICEDTTGDQFIRGLSPVGEIFDLVRQPQAEGRVVTEFAGSCFSPDGRILFFNVQGSLRTYRPPPGATYALVGPWREGPL